MLINVGACPLSTICLLANSAVCYWHPKDNSVQRTTPRWMTSTLTTDNDGNLTSIAKSFVDTKSKKVGILAETLADHEKYLQGIS